MNLSAIYDGVRLPSGRYQRYEALGLWEVKPRPPPKATRPKKIAKYSIDYSTYQLPASDKWLYGDPEYLSEA